MALKYHTVSAFLLSIVFSLNGCNSDEIDSLNSKIFELTEEINLIKDNAALSNENLNGKYYVDFKLNNKTISVV